MTKTEKQFGRYRVLAEIGQGAYGTVYLADDGAGGKIALKVCARPEFADDIGRWERERRGWALFSRLPRHPGLVHVLDFGEESAGDTGAGGVFWVAMELADPEIDSAGATSYRPKTLAALLSGEIALPVNQCIGYGLMLASALEHLQRHHLLHRDVKPENILFVHGRPVIADAGLVVDAREAASLVGTPGYVPPENHGTPQGDVFSLGCTLWRMAAGRDPAEAGAAPRAEADTGDADLRGLLDIAARAMSEAPERRYNSAKAMRKALARLRRRRLMRAVRRHLLWLLATLCATMLLALAWALGRRSGYSSATKRIQQESSSEDALIEQLRGRIRSGEIHIITPEEGKRIAEEAQKTVDNAVRHLQLDRGIPTRTPSED